MQKSIENKRGRQKEPVSSSRSVTICVTLGLSFLICKFGRLEMLL